ncbi:MAG: phytanoyl-CoA dioxygenase family protein [Planctomycetes bacterium]|nr:phytanoyl-CoA dioxygenase family protein [Planctomycetota bacterium]
MTELTLEQRSIWESTGHVTVPGVFSESDMAETAADLTCWGEEFLATLPPENEAWFLEHSTQQRVLRKLDNPVFHRPVFRRLAGSPLLVSLVEQLIGPDLRVFFSQVFLKPPEAGGPKPVHQDNFYFGPADLHRVLTAWIAIDEATTENGCLYFATGSHGKGVLQHVAPPGEPFNLQLPPETAARFEMTPEPVPRGGVSFHHGNTLHQSSANRSSKPRRAVAMHFLSGDNELVQPALDYDSSVVVRITGG